MSDSITYKDSGVDTEKAAKVLGEFSQFLGSRKSDPANLSGIGHFAALYDLAPTLKGIEHPVLVSCCDGVGTKVKLAEQWGGTENLGQDLVAMNVNDMLCAGAAPLVFLDYYACGKIEEKHLLNLLSSIQSACERSECALIGGETAEMPGVYQGKDFDLAGFSVGIADRSRVLGAQKVDLGDRLIAIESSGPHSNGYSLIRKLVEAKSVQPNARPDFGDGKSWKELLLAPTHLYVKALKPILGQFHALAHITGGGLYENLPRVLPAKMKAAIKRKAWELPPLFKWLKEAANLDERQVHSTFNNGVGMIGILPEENFQSVLKQIQSTGLQCWELGEIRTRENADQPSVEWED